MSKKIRNNSKEEVRSKVARCESFLEGRLQIGALYLSDFLNTLVSRDQMRHPSKRLSLPTSGNKGDLVRAICAHGRSMALAGGRTSFVRTVRDTLEECWGDEEVEGARITLGLSEDLTKSEVLDMVLDGIRI